MDVIAQALFFGFRVTCWLGVQTFHISCHANKAIFEGMLRHALRGFLMRSRFRVILTSIVIWSGLWAIAMALFSGPEGLLSGAVIGGIWGIFCAIKTLEAWDIEGLIYPPDEEEEQVRLLNRPYSLEDESRPLAPVDEFVDDDDGPIIITDMEDGEDDFYYDIDDDDISTIIVYDDDEIDHDDDDLPMAA